MDLKKLFIGIDSGGTNCRIGLGGNSGKIIHSGKFESVHYSQAGAKAFAAHISKIINDFCAGINLELRSVSGVCAGAAGARHRQDKQRIKEHLSDMLSFSNIIVESDSEIAYQSAFGDGDGLLMICGTGSILFGKRKGVEVRIGGWGKLLGDEGSSYSLSLGMLRRLAVRIDETNEAGELEICLRNEFGLTRENLLNEIYHKNFSMQSLAPLVVRLAGEGENICRETADSDVEGLLRLFRTYRKRFSDSVPTDVAFLGSVIENENYISSSLRKGIENEFGNAFVISEERINTVKGAIKTAIKYFNE